MHALMPDLLSKAKRFCERAEECTKLAELTTKNKMRRYYKRIADDRGFPNDEQLCNRLHSLSYVS
jgi:hypothetical protein